MPSIDFARNASDRGSIKEVTAPQKLHNSVAASDTLRDSLKRFGDKAYAFEELVAELGSAFLCCSLAITPEVRDDHAEYLAHWITILKADKRAIFTAASHASKAVGFLHGLQTSREWRLEALVAIAGFARGRRLFK